MLKQRDANLPPVPGTASLDADTLATVDRMIRSVRLEGSVAVQRLGRKFGDLGPTESIRVLGPSALQQALEQISAADRSLLEQTADRIRTFAQAQRDAIQPVDIAVPGGRAGLNYAPMERVGCYAPGGRYPLPSSVLMTAITAKVAGVRDVWVASPRPAAITLAAAAIAGADHFFCMGGAQAIAALAYGIHEVPRCDLIVGPGNRWVSAAKQLVSGDVAIDMVAGPSELTVLADEHADAELIAADLLAQAEHDPDAIPILLSQSEAMIDAVNDALKNQLKTLPTATVAREALKNGYAVSFPDFEKMASFCDSIAPEHVALHLQDAQQRVSRLHNYGAVFVGDHAAEVFGDYGAGPNHVLPTAGSARRTGALSILNFLRAQTWLHLEDPRPLAEQAARFGRIEGLEAHSRAADFRNRRP
ncbi:MAG: histidinol dehydrogenase [Rhodobacterales bacterium]|nr:histidinol dehydrogenase [Rhodobacterales bacterium]